MSNTNFDAAYKKASGRLRLQSKLREHVTSDAAFKIYQMMILPIITYSGMIKLLLSNTQLAKYTSIENRARDVIENEKHIPQLENTLKKKACTTVKSAWRMIHVCVAIFKDISRSMITSNIQ